MYHSHPDRYKREFTAISPKQFAYAQNKLSGRGGSKMEAARLANYSPGSARNTHTKIEQSKGYKAAMGKLAVQSNNLLLKVLYEFDRRDLATFSNKDLTSAVNAITSSWAKIDTQRKDNKNKDPEQNPLRALYVQRAQLVDPDAPKMKIRTVVEPVKQLEQTYKDVGDLDLDF